MNTLIFSITLLARRSNKHAGTRYLKRGLNEDVLKSIYNKIINFIY